MAARNSPDVICVRQKHNATMEVIRVMVHLLLKPTLSLDHDVVVQPFSSWLGFKNSCEGVTLMAHWCFHFLAFLTFHLLTSHLRIDSAHLKPWLSRYRIIPPNRHMDWAAGISTPRCPPLLCLCRVQRACGAFGLPCYNDFAYIEVSLSCNIKWLKQSRVKPSRRQWKRDYRLFFK